MKRQARLAIDLGGEQIDLRRIEAQEGLSEPFTMLVDVVAPLGEVDLLPHLGKPVAIAAAQDGVLQRHFHGLMLAGDYLHEDGEGFHYRLTLRPWTQLLDENRNFAIFQDKSALDIIKTVFDASGLANVDYGLLHRSRPPRPYCVQYGESDFAFVSRLMEEEGLYYFFRHQSDGHVLTLCEGPESHQKGTPARLVFNPLSGSMTNADTRVESARADLHGWHERVTTRAQARVTMRDWNFEKAGAPIEVVKTDGAAHPQDERELYLWPGRYAEEDVGRPLGQVQLEAARAQRLVYLGESQAIGVVHGTQVSVTQHPNTRFNTDYLIVRTHHVIAAETRRSGSGGGESRVSFEAIPAATPFRAPVRSPRPVVKGPETAIVTGPAGEEIFTDKYGRVKVRFHWDRAHTPGERSTCWIRVSQTGGLGNLILPRVGHEVIVDFLHGDPDRPIVTGRVFNSLHMPTYALPEHKTRALWRTKRYGAPGSYGKAMALDTGEPGVNELRFEDRGGKEEVFLHAERDMNIRVRHSESHHVGLDQETRIGNDRTEHVVNNESVTIDGARRTTITKDDTLQVKQALRIKAGTTITIEAGTSITLKVGQSTVVIDPTNIKVQAALQALVKAGMQVDVKSTMTNVKGDGMLTLKGGMTMINT